MSAFRTQNGAFSRHNHLNDREAAAAPKTATNRSFQISNTRNLPRKRGTL